MRYGVRFCLLLMLAFIGVRPVTAQPVEGGAQRYFPTEGRFNAFVIFVQHRDDRYDNELTTDRATEWPAERSRSRARALPAWAGDDGSDLIAPPGTDPARFPEGSISRFYDVMSGGRFILTGDVYPRVYIPEHDKSFYARNHGRFKNGALRLTHEILTSREVQDYFNRKYTREQAASLFDRYTNGTDRKEPDGKFDLIILVFRLSGLPELIGKGSGYTSITSLGEFSGKTGDSFSDFDQPITLGGLDVIDNIRSGSGIIAEGYTLKRAVRVIAHEIGHRQLYYEHTCEGNAVSAGSDCIGIMGGPYLTMSAPERMKLDWTGVRTIDVSSIRSSVEVELRDALQSGEVLRLTDGPEPGCGDVIVEARRWSNFWDSPPDGKNDDGDHGDFYLPQEGLYLYKSADGATCGGRTRRYSSLESNGERRDPTRGFRHGEPYRAAFAQGDTYGPATTFKFRYHKNPTLDARLAITDITPTPRGFTFKVWNNAGER